VRDAEWLSVTVLELLIKAVKAASTCFDHLATARSNSNCVSHVSIGEQMIPKKN
jgi:hypothetical protein